MSWEKPAPAAVAAFEAGLPEDAAVERRRMFGCPCAFVRGNMFAGVHAGSIILRLPPQRRADLERAGTARPFALMGRTMREYVALPGAGGAQVAGLLREAFAFAGALPAKLPRARAKKPA